MDEKENKDESRDKVGIFSNVDDKLKFLGKMLSNDNSRQIMVLLINNEMTSNEISFSSGLSLSLVIYHLEKMKSADIVFVSKVTTNSKNQSMKYYTAKSGIVILPKQASEKAKESKSFSKSLMSIMKFSAIGIAGIFGWFFSKSNVKDDLLLDVDPPSKEMLGLISQNEILLSATISLSIIVIGLIIERVISHYKNK